MTDKIEIKRDTLNEIKYLAKYFLDRSLVDVDYATKNPYDFDLAIIGLRMVETLFPREYQEYFNRLCEAINKDIKDEKIGGTDERQ